uniref:Kinetochore protein SPC25 n=2 Tax=Rhodosorus marinus TaxID=101924 RepID=A0A7S3A8N0_9RHOD|mmetsp:Transcript_5732/g.24186  ORF Transcript_5732/g.24186 Transcript_5732/m.24186 type:complete len:225 (+) Transcript_5732:249-923(+)
MDIAKVEQLGDNLEKARKQFDSWASEQVGAQELLKQQHAKSVGDLSRSIDELKERETEAKKEQADFNRKLENQKQELEDLRAGISRLGLRKQTLPEKKEQLAEAIRSVKDETHVQRKDLDAATREMNTALASFNSTIELYEKYLGLKFEVQEESLKFIFTDIDPSDRERAFTFCLRFDGEVCRVFDCQPPLGNTSNMTTSMGNRRELSGLVLAMRKLFVDLARQ